MTYDLCVTVGCRCQHHNTILINHENLQDHQNFFEDHQNFFLDLCCQYKTQQRETAKENFDLWFTKSLALTLLEIHDL